MAQHQITLDGTHDQMLEINGNVPSFDANISIIPENKDTPYTFAIASQSQMDDPDKPLAFSTLKGEYRKTFSYKPINGEKPDSFSVIMSSKEKSNHTVIIELIENEINPPPQQPVVEQFEQEKPNNTAKYIKIVIAVIIIGVGAYFLYNFWKKSKTVQDPLKSVIPLLPTQQAVPTLPTQQAAPFSKQPAVVDTLNNRLSASSSESIPTKHRGKKSVKPNFSFY